MQNEIKILTFDLQNAFDGTFECEIRFFSFDQQSETISRICSFIICATKG